jgi:hypothetical protein
MPEERKHSLKATLAQEFAQADQAAQIQPAETFSHAQQMKDQQNMIVQIAIIKDAARIERPDTRAGR